MNIFFFIDVEIAKARDIGTRTVSETKAVALEDLSKA